MKRLFSLLAFALLFSACATRTPVKYEAHKDLEGYKYAIISQNSTLNSGSVYYGVNTPYGTTLGAAVSENFNPSDMIVGMLMDRGFVIVDSAQNEGTLLIKYGQSTKRVPIGTYKVFGTDSQIQTKYGTTLSTSIQMSDAHTQEVVFECQAQGQSANAATQLQKAINLCFEKFFVLKFGE